jgi:RsiW-degrading membrane proteinase PrsW (M82 family)
MTSSPNVDCAGADVPAGADPAPPTVYMPTARSTSRLARTNIAGCWAWVLVLTVGSSAFLLIRWVCLSTGNPNLVPTLLLLGAAVAPVTFATFIHGLNIDVRFTLSALAGVAVLSGLIGVATSGLLEFDTLRRLGALPVTGVAVIEEAAKMVVPGLVLWVCRPTRKMDGITLGVASGAGFAVLETMGYSATALIHSNGNLAAVDDVLFQRGFFSPATHMAWTGLTVAALWSAAQRRWNLRSVIQLVAVFSAAVGLHAVWDSATGTATYLWLAVLGLTALGFVVHSARRVVVEAGGSADTARP